MSGVCSKREWHKERIKSKKNLLKFCMQPCSQKHESEACRWHSLPAVTGVFSFCAAFSLGMSNRLKGDFVFMYVTFQIMT